MIDSGTLVQMLQELDGNNDAASVRLRAVLIDYEALLNSNTELASKADAGEKFKLFVHSYLDEHDVPHGDPSNQHQIEGCRIGARLDLVFAQRDELAEKVKSLEQDAERWRKLRLSHESYGQLIVCDPHGGGLHHAMINSVGLDAAIDSMEATPQ